MNSKERVREYRCSRAWNRSTGGTVADDGHLADVPCPAADALGLHEVAEGGGGLESGDVAGGGAVSHGVALVVELALGEEDGHLYLAGAGASVLALAVAALGFLAGYGDTGAVDDGVELVRQRLGRQRDNLAPGDEPGPAA
jgi:hypothetical protein